MSLAEETELTEEEIDDFLGGKETGVLTLARADDPYAIPISYGYDATDRKFYLRLVSTPESEKRRFLDSSPQARLIVYDEEPESTYWSVVAEGTFVQVAPEELTVERVEQYGEAKRPLFEIWGADKEALDILLYELEPDSLSGRRTVVDREGADAEGEATAEDA